LATGAGTLVLAVATFGAVRSSNRSARIAEQALQEQRRPVLVQARTDDPPQRVLFSEGHWANTEGSRAVVEGKDGAIYLAMPVRNVGAGIAVLQGWHVWTDRPTTRDPHPPPEEFRAQLRDNYVAPADIGIWQGAVRGAQEEVLLRLERVRQERRIFAIELLYTDGVGAQRTISRFAISPEGDDEWTASVVRHWNLDAPEVRQRPEPMDGGIS
jgi:hypothetical protein